MSRVDVIIPCYRYAKFLRGCVESVLSQSGPDIRILILDDASPDRTPEIAAELVAEDERVEFRRHLVNQGHIATFNEGLDWARGEYTVLLSADDMLTPGALSRAGRLMDQHPNVGLVYGKAVWFRDGQPLPAIRSTAGECVSRVVEGCEWLEDVCRAGANPITSPEVMVRTQLQHKIGGYKTKLTHTGDLEMWLRFAAHADVGILEADQAYYRRHLHNMSLSYGKTVRSGHMRCAIKDYRQRKAAFDTLFEEQDARIVNCASMKDLAFRSIAWDALWSAGDALEMGDPEGCQDLLDFAIELDPELRMRPQWTRMNWKKRLGPRIWPRIKPLVSRLRRLRATT